MPYFQWTIRFLSFKKFRALKMSLIEKMPTKLERKRIVFVNDNLWEKIERLSKEKEISRSCALRIILGKNDKRDN